MLVETFGEEIHWLIKRWNKVNTMSVVDNLLPYKMIIKPNRFVCAWNNGIEVMWVELKLSQYSMMGLVSGRGSS